MHLCLIIMKRRHQTDVRPLVDVPEPIRATCKAAAEAVTVRLSVC